MEVPWLCLSLTGDPEAECGRGALVLSRRGLRGWDGGHPALSRQGLQGLEGAPGSEPRGSPRCLDEGTGPCVRLPSWGALLGVTAPPATMSFSCPGQLAPGHLGTQSPFQRPQQPPWDGGLWRRENLLYREHSHTPGGTHRSTQRHTHTHATRTYPHHTHAHVPAHHAHAHTHTHVPACPRWTLRDPTHAESLPVTPS